MANILKEVLNAAGMRLTLPCGGPYTQAMSYVGVNLSGVWSGLVNFFGSFDGIKFFPTSFTPFASGTTVQSATGNGNWFLPVQNYVAAQVQVATLNSGSVTVSMAASIDSSWQDALLASTSKFVTQESGGGLANVITQAAQANRAWRLRTLAVAFSVAAGAAVPIQVSDGASAVLWKSYVPLGAGSASGGGTWLAPLPADFNTPGVSAGGVFGTPGNSMVVQLSAPGGAVVSELNCEFIASP
jgi:hypothetical protein